MKVYWPKHKLNTRSCFTCYDNCSPLVRLIQFNFVNTDDCQQLWIRCMNLCVLNIRVQFEHVQLQQELIIIGVVNRYGWSMISTIYRVYGWCWALASFCPFSTIIYNLQWLLKLEIWWVLCWHSDRWQTDTTDHFTPCTHAQGNNLL